ncbi:MAG: MATE family efflux transporter [Candidatus Onthomonas sp.]
MNETKKTDRKSRMATEPMVPLVLSVSLPLMISLIVQALYNLVDSFFVARLSENALTATSLASPIQILMVAVSVGTGVGVNSLLSRSLGAGKRDDACMVATTGLILAILSSLVFILFGVFFSKPFLRAFTTDADLLEQSYIYLSTCTILCTGIFIATTAERLLQATGNSVLSMCAQVTGAVANCILDPILIFGYFGAPAMGIRGAAIATVFGQWLAAVIAMILNFCLNHDIEFRFRGFRFRKDIVCGIYTVGAPAMLANGLTSIQTICMNKMLIGFSATAVAFFGLFHKIQTFVMMPCNGLSQGLIPVAGYSFGGKRGDRLMEAFRVTLKIAVCVMAVCTLILECFPKQILQFFNASDDMLSMGVPAVRILASTFLLITVVNVIGHMYTAMGNGMINLSCNVIRGLLPLPIVYCLAKFTTINYVWFAIPCTDIIAFALAMILFVRIYKKTLRPMELQALQQHK